jgi:acetoacetyl-CoA synthetase
MMVAKLATPVGADDRRWADPRHAKLATYCAWLGRERGQGFADEQAVREWSIQRPVEFWTSVAEYFDLFEVTGPALRDDANGAVSFPQARLNYAELATERVDDSPAVVFLREDGLQETCSWRQLRSYVARCRTGLARLGVRSGSRVAGVLPNTLPTVVAFLATASLGAVWSVCPPDASEPVMRRRIARVEPAVLLGVDGYVRDGRRVDVRERLSVLHQLVGPATPLVIVPYLDPDARLAGGLDWGDLMARGEEFEFAKVPFGHPLWVLHPTDPRLPDEPVVHGHGAVVLEHAKQLALQLDIGWGTRSLWISKTDSVLWNLLVSGLLVGATIVLYDGSPDYPDSRALWQAASLTQATFVGVGASRLRPDVDASLVPGSLRSLSVLCRPSAARPRWVSAERLQRSLGSRVHIDNLIVRTDLCTAVFEPDGATRREVVVRSGVRPVPLRAVLRQRRDVTVRCEPRPSLP